MSFKEISVYDIKENAFDLIGKQWMLVAAKSGEKVNAMTASWGGIGIMWGVPVAYVFIRPQRYTKQFIDEAEGMSLTFFDESYRKMLSYMGTVSGRNEDKIEKSGLGVELSGDIPYFKEGKMTLITKKKYMQKLDRECLICQEIHNKWYPGDDYHYMYICEIEKVLVSEEE